MHNTRSYNNVVTNYWVLSVNWKGERLCVLKAKKPDTAEGWSPSSSLQLLFQDELMVPMVAAVSSGECSGTYAALRAAEGQGVLWAWAATQGTVVRLEAGGLVRSGFQLCSGQTSGVSYLGCCIRELLHNILWDMAGSRFVRLWRCQLFTLHSVRCAVPFAMHFLSRNTAKVSEVSDSVDHCTIMH